MAFIIRDCCHKMYTTDCAKIHLRLPSKLLKCIDIKAIHIRFWHVEFIFQQLPKNATLTGKKGESMAWVIYLVQNILARVIYLALKISA